MRAAGMQVLSEQGALLLQPGVSVMPNKLVHVHTFERSLCGAAACNLLFADDDADVTCQRCLAMGGHAAAAEKPRKMADDPQLGQVLRELGWVRHA
jgi:hypothetical protein